MTNQTTYEIFYKSCINYLAKYRELKKQRLESQDIVVTYNTKFLPFDMGFIKNIKLFFEASSGDVDWLRYLIENLNYNKKRFNFCDNEYYSCF
jgi:hypothetical protein